MENCGGAALAGYARAGPSYSAESNEPPATGGQAAAQALCLLELRHLPGRISDKDLILLSANPYAGVQYGRGKRRSKQGGLGY
ncbi:hypothetical protein LSUB1_G003344 [Lachnellula subtilissima]|uniref:Uncharacterized protein n=1 Tax=Lachnellula subtilissima TaxID=602034 RepID=A0A8H8RWS4_9HELO|nr:hypothetical protein LSUB1_G003344 [Lachnellula subtilissima]